MDHTTALAELLSQHGFHRHTLARNQVGHFQLVGLLQDAPVDILLDTGAAITVVDLAFCRAHSIPTRDTGRLGGGAGGSRWQYMPWMVRRYHWMVALFAVMVSTLSILPT